MIFILSPAKKMQESQIKFSDLTLPVFERKTRELLQYLNVCSPQKIASLMKISDALAWKNKQRYQDILNGSAPIYPAIELFAGDVYRGLDYSSLNQLSRKYLENQLLILSGLYGVLKPRDGISPYRLEMGTSLSTTSTDNLYEFWNGLLHEYIIQKIQDDINTEKMCLINLASQEYAKAVDFKKIPYPVITPVFKRINPKNGQYQIVGVLAKYARGLMVRYAAERQLTNIEDLKTFNLENYIYRPDLSNTNEWIFIQTN
ncbi:MAG: peroxide stress protein YaaA [Neisseriaceae bacterium]|nr:MAG: peroxide stress protein YaaA [Neisseriaceae bacterium]